MKSIIKRLKRRSSPTTASVPMVPPVLLQTDHPPKDTTPSNQQQSIRTREVFFPPFRNSSFESQMPSGSFAPISSIAQDKSQESVNQAGSSLRILQNINSLSTVAVEDSSCNQIYPSRVSSNSEQGRSGHLSHETQSEFEKNEAISNPSFKKGSSIRTFGDKPHRQHQTKITPAVSDSERDSTADYEEKHTLKPITRETIHKHIVEEVQKVKLHERHLTYIQHHVQPIITPSCEVEFQDYRIELQEPPVRQGDRINIKGNSKLDTIIQDFITNNKHRYETGGLQSFPTSESIGLSDIEHQATVVHNYHIIQPVILKSNHVLQDNLPFETNKHGVHPSQVESKKEAPVDINAQQIRQLNKLIDSLQAENRDLKKLLADSLASRSFVG